MQEYRSFGKTQTKPAQFMPTATKTPEDKAVFRYRLEQIRPRLKRYAALVVNSLHPHIHTERVYNVLRTPIRCYDDEVLDALESIANTNVPA
jgi:hypothetical protein